MIFMHFNSFSRTGAVLQDLSVLSLLDACILSEEEGVEKPNAEIWRRGLKAISVSPDSDSLTPRSLGKHEEGDWDEVVMHVGDEIKWYVLIPIHMKNKGLRHSMKYR